MSKDFRVLKPGNSVSDSELLKEVLELLSVMLEMLFYRNGNKIKAQNIFENLKFAILKIRKLENNFLKKMLLNWLKTSKYKMQQQINIV